MLYYIGGRHDSLYSLFCLILFHIPSYLSLVTSVLSSLIYRLTSESIYLNLRNYKCLTCLEGVN